MISPHLRDRFFQRYCMELTLDKMREIVRACTEAKGKPNSRPGVEEVSFVLWGHTFRVAWVRKQKMILTFLPEPGMKKARYVGKGKRR